MRCLFVGRQNARGCSDDDLVNTCRAKGFPWVPLEFPERTRWEDLSCSWAVEHGMRAARRRCGWRRCSHKLKTSQKYLKFGTFRKAVFQPAGFCIPLLRPHSHPRISERAVAPGTSGLLFPRRDRGSRGGQSGVEQTDWRVSGLGGGVRPQSQDPRGVGPKRCPDRRLRAALVAPHGAGRPASMASISSSKAWSKGRPFAVPCPSSPPRIPTTAFCERSGAALRTTISTCGMKRWGRW